METNFQMIRSFEGFKPKHFGVLSGEEVTIIKNHFQLAQKNDTELQNLRDFVVLFYSRKELTMEESDIMSAIVGVIDQEKFNRGLEV